MMDIKEDLQVWSVSLSKKCRGLGASLNEVLAKKLQKPVIWEI